MEKNIDVDMLSLKKKVEQTVVSLCVSLPNVEHPMVLLRFRSNMWNKKDFVQFSLNWSEQTQVLLCVFVHRNHAILMNILVRNYKNVNR